MALLVGQLTISFLEQSLVFHKISLSLKKVIKSKLVRKYPRTMAGQIMSLEKQPQIILQKQHPSAIFF